MSIVTLKIAFIFLTIYAKVYIIKEVIYMKLNIKPLVDAKGLNRNQLSKELKIGYQATCNLYDGNAQRIYFDTLQRLCDVLECTPNDILISEHDTKK